MAVVANPLTDGGYPTGHFSNTPDTPDGFGRFFSAIARDDSNGKPLELTEHAFRWLEFLYDCKENDNTAIVEAFRGAGKSVFATAFAAWRIGHDPTKTNMIIRSGFNAAQDTGATIAKIIEQNKNWRLFFPHVVPDTTSAWSVINGYNVRDLRMSEGRWAQMLSGRGPSKTLMVFPYTSGNIVGRRVSGLLLVDDIHTDENVESPSELQQVIRIWNDTIAPARLPGCWTVFIGTPWDPSDLLQQLKELRGFKFVKTPVISPDGTPTWPDMFDLEAIEKLKDGDLTGGPGFARMYLLDLASHVSRVFNYMSVHHDTVSSLWKRRSGLDYASVEGGGNLKWRSHCALANIAQNPGTVDWVVSEGYLGQVPQSVVEQWVMSNQDQFPHHEFTVIEMDGKGAEFFAVVARNKRMRLLPEKTGGRNKAKRIEELEPLFRHGQVKVADGDTPFLNTLREFLNTYPNLNPRHPGWDCADAVYWACFHMRQAPRGEKRGGTEPKETENPGFALAKMAGTRGD
mgnify:FL=1